MIPLRPCVACGRAKSAPVADARSVDQSVSSTFWNPAASEWLRPRTCGVSHTSGSIDEYPDPRAADKARAALRVSPAHARYTVALRSTVYS
jgi:hypothetical protein